MRKVTVNWTNHKRDKDDFHEDTVELLIDTDEEHVARTRAKDIVSAGGLEHIEIHEIRVESGGSRSAVNHVKQSTYTKRPQDCPCPPQSLRFVRIDHVTDEYICVECGALHRMRSREYNRYVIEMDRALAQSDRL